MEEVAPDGCVYSRIDNVYMCEDYDASDINSRTGRTVELIEKYLEEDPELENANRGFFRAIYFLFGCENPKDRSAIGEGIVLFCKSPLSGAVALETDKNKMHYYGEIGGMHKYGIVKK